MSSDPEFSTRRMDAGIPDYSDRDSDDFEALSRDRFFIRSMSTSDLEQIIRIDKKLNGYERREYFEAKLQEVMKESGVVISLVAEIDNHVAGYIMARVDFGSYGKTEPAAVIDTIGVDPGQSRGGIASGLMSQLTINLSALNVELLRTEVPWKSFPLLGFLDKSGFKPAQRLVLTKKV